MGQEVITAGGIYGKIKEIEDNTVVLEIASGVKIKLIEILSSLMLHPTNNRQSK